MIVPITPHGDRVVIKADSPETVRKSGLYIPETAQEKPQTGTIIGTGEGRIAQTTGDLIPMQTKTGDKVLFGKNAGTEINIDGEDYLIMREQDIYAILV
jgi:chaperonin GroES